MPANILLVEDDAKLAGLVAEYLEGEGFSVSLEERGDTAVGRILAEHPEIVVLDLMLPGLDGIEVCRRVRPDYPGYILMLTAKSEEIDEMLGLEVGADDYVAKPVRPRLLAARLRALLRRTGRSQPAPFRAVGGRLVIDLQRRAVTVDGAGVELTSGEFELLAYLAERTGDTVDRDALYEGVRGVPYDGLDRSIDLRIARLRKKLGDDGKHPATIKSVRGRGYMLVP
jgi:two-component system response regulator RstA